MEGKERLRSQTSVRPAPDADQPSTSNIPDVEWIEDSWNGRQTVEKTNQTENGEDEFGASRDDDRDKDKSDGEVRSKPGQDDLKIIHPQQLKYTADDVCQWSVEEYVQKYRKLQDTITHLQLELAHQNEEIRKYEDFTEFLSQERCGHNLQMKKVKRDLEQEKNLYCEVNEEIEKWNSGSKNFELTYSLNEQRLKELETVSKELRGELHDLEKDHLQSVRLQQRSRRREDAHRTDCVQVINLEEKVRSMSQAGVNKRHEQAQLWAKNAQARYEMKNSIETQTDTKLSSCEICGTCLNGGDNPRIELLSEINTESTKLSPKVELVDRDEKSEPSPPPHTSASSTDKPNSLLASIFSNLKNNFTKKSSISKAKASKSSFFSGIRKLFRNKNRVIPFNEDF